MSLVSIPGGLLLSVASMLSFGFPSSGTSGGLERVVELARGGAYRRALVEAESLTSSVERAQAKLYVLHHAGDLTGALAIGREGLSAEPNDLWLLERVCFITLSLRAADLAGEHVDRLAKAVDAAQLPEDKRTSWRGVVGEYRAQVADLEASANERMRAARSARWAVWLGLSVAAALLAVLGLPSARPPTAGSHRAN